MSPIATAATRVPWQFFCSLTYESNLVGETEDERTKWIRRRMLFQWVRKVERTFGIPKGKLVFLPREERGEKRGRFHWHVLLCGLYHVPGRGVVPSPNLTTDCFKLMSLWEQCGNAAGMARVREYDTQLSGVAYVLKGLGFVNWDTEGANAYEVAKFNEDEEGRELILAPQFIAKVNRLCRRNRRHRKARELEVVSRDRSAPGALPTVRKPAKLKHEFDTTPKPHPKKRRRDWSWKPINIVNPGSPQA